MQIVLHTGAHNTDDDRLLRCLLKNKANFQKRGVSVPAPSRYRALIRDTLNAMTNEPPSADAREILLDTILDEDPPDRLLLSNSSFFGVPKTSVKKGVFYPFAENKLSKFSQLFPDDQIELFLAIRDPASFLPAMFADIKETDFVTFMGGTDPRDMRWSNLISRIRDAVPDIAITVWCNEDTPMIWAQLIREMAGLEHNEKISGGFDLLADIMTREGMKRFRAYLKTHPKMSEVQKRRVISAFLDKFAIEDAIEEELDLPGWTEDLIDELGDIYDEDVFQIARLPGVQLISP